MAVKNQVLLRFYIIIGPKFNEFYFGKANITSKTLFDQKILVTSRLYTERKTEFLV